MNPKSLTVNQVQEKMKSEGCNVTVEWIRRATSGRVTSTEQGGVVYRYAIPGELTEDVDYVRLDKRLMITESGYAKLKDVYMRRREERQKGRRERKGTYTRIN